MRAVPRPSVLLTLTAALAAATSAHAQQRGVTGFHGYPWGTHGAGIEEIARAPRVGEKDGLAIHSAELRFLGREALAGFYLDPGTGRLVEGAYAMHVGLEECQATWDRVVDALRKEHPALSLDVERTRRSAGDDVYASDCEHYVYTYRDGDEAWRAELAARDPALGRVLVRMQPVGRVLRMTVLYQGPEARARAARDGGKGA